MSNTLGLYWFTNDLRLADNALLWRAAREVDTLICLYCYPAVTPFLAHFSQQATLGSARRRFLNESLVSLAEGLAALGQRLWVTELSPGMALDAICQQWPVTHFYVDAVPGADELQVVAGLQAKQAVVVHQEELRSLFGLAQLPFALSGLPATFSQFRRWVEPLDIAAPLPIPTRLPPPDAGWPNVPGFVDARTLPAPSADLAPSHRLFIGGEVAGLAHCQRYFASALPATYKETRNGLDGMDYSTKLSPWLALGCLSARSVYAMLRHYEQHREANESTYWIFFELLWREYFYWYARAHQRRLFQVAGITAAPRRRQRPVDHAEDLSRLLHWQQGETAFATVNACMRQLQCTGYMSNRGRQWVASCLVHELGLDWRAGAAYFETQLVDYDVASNWGNWQYLAGVGADPRGSRQFNLQKQALTYDPAGEFVARWSRALGD